MTSVNGTATDADYSFLPAELLIRSGQPQGTGTLLLVPTDDLVDEDDETLEVRGVTHVPGLTVSVQQVTITDNDSAGVTITPTSLTVLESQSNRYAVKLTSQPTADVTVAIGGHAGTALTLSGTTLVSDSLTFTPENWNTPQTVAVNAGSVTADTDVTLVHGISGGDYGSVTAADVAVTVVDIPENQVTIRVGVTLSRQALTVPEGGSNTYEVVLGHQPTVDDTANNDVTTEEGSLVFTTANWDEPQTVTVRAAEDDDALPDSNVTVSHTVGGANYEGVVVPGLTVSITENDAVGVNIAPTSLTVTEGDATGVSYTVALTSQPAGDVTVTVTVKAAEDDDAVTDAALADQSVTVSITENDEVGVNISPTNLTVTEGDATGVSYTVVLTSQPAGDVTVTVSGHSGTDLTLSGTGLSEDGELTFTTENWGTAQTVTVKAAEDDDAVTDDAVGITLSPTTLTVNEGSTADYTVEFSVQPTSDVTINITGGGDVTVNPTSLTFSSVTWNTAQTVTVTVTADQDDDGADDTQTVGHA